MDFSWWNGAHATLWRIADRADLLALRDRARQTAHETIAPLLSQSHSTHQWTEGKASILRALDAQGLTGFSQDAHNGLAVPLALSVFELATVDAGVATCSLSGSLAQMPIRDFGTQQQRERYLHCDELRHGALCLTEPLPGAGAEAISLAGRMISTGTDANGEPLLEIRKRGRFISHMDFAEFVVVAVEGEGVRGSGLVILEPDDAGRFERGTSTRKLGHRFASTTDPIFHLRVPASRMVGGFTSVDGVIVPRFSHRVLLEPALRRMRALLGVMTAAKALSTVAASIDSPYRRSDGVENRLSMADLWATGEAAASLGFCVARLSDNLDRAEHPSSADAKRAALFSSAAKLFSSSRVSECLWNVSASSHETLTSFDLHSRLLDAQIEDMYMGPSALQRRMVSAAMTSASFLSDFQQWTAEVVAQAECLPQVGICSLAEGMRLWHWTLERLREKADAHGAQLFCDARQGVSFAMADTLCGLLAARSLFLDVLEMDSGQSSRKCAAVFQDLSILAAGRAATRGLQSCTDLLFGYADRFPVFAAGRSAFEPLRANLCASLRGVMDARERISEFLSLQQQRL